VLTWRVRSHPSVCSFGIVATVGRRRRGAPNSVPCCSSSLDSSSAFAFAFPCSDLTSFRPADLGLEGGDPAGDDPPEDKGDPGSRHGRSRRRLRPHQVDGGPLGGVGGFSRIVLEMTRSKADGDRERERASDEGDSGRSCESSDAGLVSMRMAPDTVRWEDAEDRSGELDEERFWEPSGADRDCPRGRPLGGTGRVGGLDAGKELTGVRVGLRGEDVLGIKGVLEFVMVGEMGRVDPLGLVGFASDIATA
jgi:hypothetical protein